MAESFGLAFDPSPILDTVPRDILPTTGAVVDAMRTHPEALARAGLDHLVYFAEIYLGVTDRAHRKHELGLPPELGGFVRPDTVATAIPDFSQQWFDHLLNLADGNYDAIPPVWRLAFFHPGMRKANPGIQFALPMGGHIDSDLGRTVFRVGAPSDYYGDYTDHIGVILGDTARAHAQDVLPVNALARSALIRGVLALIAWKREVAWKQGELLIELSDDPDELARLQQQIEQYALLSGKVMLKAGDVALSQVVRFAPPFSSVKQLIQNALPVWNSDQRPF